MPQEEGNPWRDVVRHHQSGLTPEGVEITSTQRVSHAQRDQMVEHLREMGATGRIKPDELDRRIEAAYHATTIEQLQLLVMDLPGFPEPAQANHAGQYEAVTVLSLMAILLSLFAITCLWIYESSEAANILLTCALAVVCGISGLSVYWNDKRGRPERAPNKPSPPDYW